MTPDEENEGTRPPVADPPRASAPGRISWSSPELAWPLSIAAGFIGTFLGVQSGFPGAPALIAAAAFSPVFVRLLARRRVGVAFLSSAAWMVGIIAALVGVTVEGDGRMVAEAVPLATAFAAAEWSVPDGAVGTAFVGDLVRNLVVFVGLLALARPYAGVLSLLLAAYVIDLLGAGVASFAERMAAESWSPSYSAIVGSPPHLVLPLVAALAALCVIAAPGRLLPLSSLRGTRRRLFLGGTIVGLGVLLLAPVLAPLWQRTLG